MGFARSLNFSHFSGIINGGLPLQIKSGPGVLRAIVINSATTAGMILLTDGTTTVTTATIASILPTSGTTAVPNDAIYDVRFNVGLVIQVTVGTMDLTVVWE